MGSIEIMNSKQLEGMRASCRLAAQTLVMVSENLRVGMTTDEINTLVHNYTLEHGAYPSPLNYGSNPPFPKSVCTSVNECICHGIPGPYALKDGDIINVDVTCYLPAENGFHGDTSATFYIGEPSAEAKKVTEVSRKSLELAIATVKHGSRIGDIGAAIQEYAEGQGCSVVRDFVGHGVGREFHMPPQIPHYGKAGRGRRLKEGMVFTIEPMINLGTWEAEHLSDGWTAVTADRKLSAQFEHTLLVTRTGVEVLTDRPKLLVNSEDKPWSELGPLGTRAAYEAKAA